MQQNKLHEKEQIDAAPARKLYKLLAIEGEGVRLQIILRTSGIMCKSAE